MPGSTLNITPPADFVLARDVCSYGYFLLAPNRWDPGTQTLTRPLHLAGGRVWCSIEQRNAGPGEPLRVRTDRALEPKERGPAKKMIARMLDFDADIAGFHKLDPRWKKSGRGRLFRAPTMFEDVIKTVTSCNVAWTSTIRMNQNLCSVIDAGFPRATQLARRRATTLRTRCGVGYRDQRIIDLAKLFASPKKSGVDPAWFEDRANSDGEVFDALLALPGIGPYAAGNIMQLLGRTSRLAIDTESVRHAKSTLGWSGSDTELIKRLEARYEPFGPHKFRSYWFELWSDYEARKGPAWTWDPKTTATAFTAAKLNAKSPRAGANKRTATRAASRKTPKVKA